MKDFRAHIMALVLFAFLALSVSSASASPLLNFEIVGFANGNFTVGNNGNNPTALTFASSTIASSVTCAGTNAALCSGPVTIGPDTTFDSGGAADVIALSPSLKYTTSSVWTEQGSIATGLTIFTTGIFSATGFDNTAGRLNFSLQPPQNAQGMSNFSASGSTVPEPATLLLTSFGGLALIGLAKIRKKRAIST